MRGNLAVSMTRFLAKPTLGWATTVHRKLPRIGKLPPATSDELRTNHVPQEEEILCNISVVADVLECRICQEEDLERNMESPCSCCGSLKYAHRSCVQRWCDEKGDTCCEICLQQFQPGYTAPLSSPRSAGVPGDLRTDAVPGRAFHDSYLVPVVAMDNTTTITEDGYGREDDYGTADDDDIWLSRSAAYCRVFAITFMALFFLRHALPILFGEEEEEEYSVVEFTALLLRIVGILLPIYAISRTFSSRCSRCTQLP